VSPCYLITLPARWSAPLGVDRRDAFQLAISCAILIQGLACLNSIIARVLLLEVQHIPVGSGLPFVVSVCRRSVRGRHRSPFAPTGNRYTIRELPAGRAEVLFLEAARCRRQAPFRRSAALADVVASPKAERAHGDPLPGWAGEIQTSESARELCVCNFVRTPVGYAWPARNAVVPIGWDC
jgi:hypothetical protein